MKLSIVRTSFSQFSDGLRLRAQDGDARIECDLVADELRDFSLMLLDLADDCMARLGGDYSGAREKLDEAAAAIRAS